MHRLAQNRVYRTGLSTSHNQDPMVDGERILLAFVNFNLNLDAFQGIQH